MSELISKIENILTSEYSGDNYVTFITEIFDAVKIVSPDKFTKEYSNFSSHIEGYSHVGTYVDPDGKKIAIFSVELKTSAYVENSRSIQRSYARKLIEVGNCDAALVAFYTKGDSKWRLSFVRLDYEMKFEKGKFKTTENLTPAKRYSFLVGKDEPCHTAIERFRGFIIDKNYNPSLDELEEAFSVEKVTNEFFKLYCEKFYQLIEHLEQNDDFVAESKRCGFTSEQFAKKLMGQIVFLYFLQKKGWLGVNVWAKTLTEKEYQKALYAAIGAHGRIMKEELPKIYLQQPDGSFRFNSKALDEMSEENEIIVSSYMPRVNTWGSGSRKFLRTIFEWSQKNKGHFYEEYLEPLFYDTLNRNRSNIYDYCSALHCRVPFLSGGLFEPIDGYDWKANYFDIPDEIFSNKAEKGERNADGILDIFDRYNFTMSEDEPMEREVAIDPEMLGKVFENLLEIKDRKSKGAFYTPREIVHYMCQESLINYLARKTEIDEEDIRDFIVYGDFMRDEDTTKEKREGNGGMFISESIFKIDNDGKVVVNRLKDIDDALATVKVADPAVGSGAFPLGMVNEIVRARQNITAYMAIGMNANNVRMMYLTDRSAYRLKYDTIKNCIYAVDIEPSAVDIAQLRLWLSIVIDDEINPNAQTELEGHKNPLPLPNLECNILCGNSLIDEFKGEKLIEESDIIGTSTDEMQLNFSQGNFDLLITKLIEEQDKLFRCDDPVKKETLKANIQAYKDKIILSKLSVAPEYVEAYNEAIKMASKPFVLWQLDFAKVFKDNGGFDIVIGNPPYVSTKGVSAEDKRLYESVYGFSDDTYNLFSFRGIKLLKEKGSLSYIIPKTFWTTQTKRNMRDLLLSNQIKYIFDTANPFDTAMVDTCIIQVVKYKFDGKNTINFYDGRESFTSPKKMSILQEKYINTQNSVIFAPTEFNLTINEKYGLIVKRLYDTWWDKIKTSKDIEKNKEALEKYRNSLKPGDVALLGCLTEGGQGLATANNGKYIAVRSSTKWAENIRKSRPIKLEQAMRDNKIPESKLFPFFSVEDLFARANEYEIEEIFDMLKEEYGRDIFGQGYIYRLVNDDEMADVSSLTQDEKDNGIDISKNYYVPYDKGDKDGNRWYLETPFAIAWSKENVRYLKTDRKARYQGYSFFFKEGFCWSLINGTRSSNDLKFRISRPCVNDVGGMTLHALTELLPDYMIVCICNSNLINKYSESFINFTVNFQVNDVRQIPIVIPSKSKLMECKSLIEQIIALKKQEANNNSKATSLEIRISKAIANLYGIDI